MQAIKANPRLLLQTILFTTDYSAASQAALPYAEAIARWYGSKVLIAHTVPPEPVLSVPMDALPSVMDLNWSKAQEKMSEFLRTEPFLGIQHEAILEQGEMWDVLEDLIKRHAVDLVVLGTHGREGLKKLVLGSAAEQIFRRAPCPVLTVGPRAARVSVSFEAWKRVLFATDFSPGSLKALPYALSLAEENQASMVFLHLIPLVPLQNQDAVRESATRRLEALVPPEAAMWCKPEYLVRFEFPADGILHVAVERQADLIVMGVHKTDTPKASAHMPWAIASEVVCGAHCPVLTVRG